MTPEQIQKMAEGCPPSSIGKDHEEVVTWLAEKHIALQEQAQQLAALAEERRVFIVNGAEMGYIQLPVFKDNPATSTYQRCLLKPRFAADAFILEIGVKAVDDSDDKKRMDRLCAHCVEVRSPQMYGSHAMFHAKQDSEEWDLHHHTTLREQVDAAISAGEQP